MSNITVQLTSGPQIVAEIKGAGRNAYESARLGGYKGSETEFYDALGTVGETVLSPHASRGEVPETGNQYFLYLDTGANKSYRWDPAERKYYVVGSDYNDITAIDGGNADGWNV